MKLWAFLCTAILISLLRINTANAEAHENVLVTTEEDSSSVQDGVHLTSKESTYGSRHTCHGENSEPVARRLNWIHNILPQRLANFRPRSKANQLCNVQSDLYVESLRNLTLWALQMKEASATSTPGMLAGERTHLGNYDECIGINKPSVSGRYCLVSINFHTTNNYPEPLEDKEALPPDSNLGDDCQKSKHSKGLDKELIQLGVCVPAACSGLDVVESLVEAFADVERDYGIALNIFSHDIFCSSSVDNEQSLTLASRALLYFIALLSALSVFSTIHHLISNDENLQTKGSIRWNILRSFSMVNNFRSLTRPSEKSSMNVLDGLKFFSMIMILIYHRLYMLQASKLFDPTYYQIEPRNYSKIALLANFTDTNFTVSGFLLFMSWYSRLKENGIKICPSIIINRWLRLMPSYVVVLLLTTILLPNIGSGPLWKVMTFPEAENCQRYWWTHLLGINNIIPGDYAAKLCLGHTWYLACDIQLLSMGVFIVYAISKNHSLGLKAYFAGLVLSIIIPFYIVYMNSYLGFPSENKRSSPPGNEIYHLNNYGMQVYIRTLCRAGPYIIGIIAGFILLKIKEGKWNLPNFARWSILFIASAPVVWSEYYSLQFFEPTREYNVLENAVFASLHRHIWGIMISTIIVIQLGWGFGKHIDQLLTHNIYVPLSRLSYLVYLSHFIWLRISIGSSRASLNLSMWNLIGLGASDIIICYLIGLWLYFIVEGPFESMRTILMNRLVPKKQHQT